jgi:hypothetical protein
MAERYKIYEQLGAGGVGTVYRAYDNELKRWVAIKRLMSSQDIGGDEKLIADLRREADALASLRNPNIVTVFDVASDAEGLFMVLELLEGEDLADVVGRGPLHYDDFKELASQTMEGLLAAHQRHILHRDIKPENIKVERLPGGRMQSKIIDFGLARAGLRARKQTEDQSGTVMGSIHYMAPEQLTRRPVDERTDMYSLGCVYYEALSGRKAFDGDTVAAVIDKHINHDLVPLHIIAPHVPPWLGAWVMRLMACNPDDRPANAQQGIEEFRTWEKMSSAPQMMPWMPMGYASMPGQYPQAMYPTGSVPMGAGTSSVPVQPIYYQTGQVPAYQTGQVPAAYPAEQMPTTAYAASPEEVIPVAQPIHEMAATTTQIHVQRPTLAAPKASGQRVGQSPALHTPARKSTSAANAPQAGSKTKLYAMIGGGVVLLIVIGFFFMRGGEVKTDTASGTKPAPPGGAPPAPNLELPQDRAFPPADADICVHLVPTTGVKKADGKPAASKDTVTEWRDLSPRGRDNQLRAADPKPVHGPRRVIWTPAPAGEAGVNGNRTALDFRSREGKGCVMNLADPGGEKAQFPFGSASTRGPKGLTLCLAYQVDATQLPSRILQLSGDGDVRVTLRVDQGKKLIAELRGAGGASATITSKDINPSLPGIAIITWDAATGEAELRAKDTTGKTFRAKATVKPPTVPLARLQIGRATDAQGKPVPSSDHFSGWLGDLILYSAVLPAHQAQMIEGTIVFSYYMHGPPAKKPAGK